MNIDRTSFHTLTLIASAIAIALIAGACTRPSHGDGRKVVFECDDYAVYADGVATPDGRFIAAAPEGAPAPERDSSLLAYDSQQPLFDSIFARACRTVGHALNTDGTPSRPVAQTSFDAMAATALTHPRATAARLRHYLRQGVIAQDPSSGGSWPVTTDRVAWIVAAEEVYCATGDRRWLATLDSAAQTTLRLDTLACWNPRYGLMQGSIAASGGDASESCYPAWMEAADRFQSMCTANNALFYRAFIIAEEARSLIGNTATVTRPRHSRMIAEALNERLWMPARNAYSQYLYCSPWPIQSGATDYLGQALCVNFGIADADMARRIVDNAVTAPTGIPRFRPTLAAGGFEPTTQAFWNLAASSARNIDALTAGIGAVALAAATGGADSVATACAALSVVLKVIAGIRLHHDRMTFAPVVPEAFGGDKSIRNLRFRDAIVDINIHGTGDIVAGFTVDGNATPLHQIADTLTGRHTVVITMANNRPARRRLTMAPDVAVAPTPRLRWNAPTEVTLPPLPDGGEYGILINDAFTLAATPGHLTIDDPLPSLADIATIAISDAGTESYTPRPHRIIRPGALTVIPATRFRRGRTRLISDRDTARQFVELSTTNNRHYTGLIDAPHAGRYMLALRYSNGASSDDGGTKCGLRTLSVNGRRVATMVLPQRGTATWPRTGLSNFVEVDLRKGRNTFAIEYLEPVNENMNRRVNTVLLRAIELISMEK